jgi:predicted DNA-binding ribbon-helix-helix protein
MLPMAGDIAMKSLVFKRSLKIAGRQTSISVENDFWSSLREIAEQRHETLSQLVSSIDAQRTHSNLSSAIRLFVLSVYRDQFDQKQGKVRSSQSINNAHPLI